MPDEEGYPTEEELNKIKNWDPCDPEGLLDFIEDLWCYTDGYRFVTAPMSQSTWASRDWLPRLCSPRAKIL